MALGLGYGLPFSVKRPVEGFANSIASSTARAIVSGATQEQAGGCLTGRALTVMQTVQPQPSLLIVPQLYKAGALYPQLPTSASGDFTVTRATTATRVNSSGLIESVASGVPRIDWLASGGVVGCPALLVEPSAQNLALQSEAFNVTWGVSNSTQISANTTGTTAPAGGNNADFIFCQASGSVVQGVDQSISVTASGTYTMSVFIKKAVNFDWFRLQFRDATGTSFQAFYNIASGTLGTIDGGGTATITNYGNGWYRITHSRSTASGNINMGLRLASADNQLLVNADGNSGTFAWGAQLEVGSVATTYIPTTSGTVSRAADVISASGALVSGLIGQTEGTLYAEVDLRNWIASGRILTCSNGTSDERIMIQVGANRTLQAIVTTASADVANISTASGQVNGVYKCALTYASGDFAFYVNGTQIGTDSSGGVPACNSVFLGKIGTSASTNFINDRIRAAALYTTRLSNDQLAELTRL